jgi:hypothetical protein
MKIHLKIKVDNRNYSQDSIKNINIILKLLKCILNKPDKINDKFTNDITSSDIFSTDILVKCIENSLTTFNEIPFFSMLTFEDDKFYEYQDIISHGAIIIILASKALIESGEMEFKTDDNNEVIFEVPSINKILSTQYGTYLQEHVENIKQIKLTMR